MAFRALTGKVYTAVMLAGKPWAPSACFFCIAVSTTHSVQGMYELVTVIWQPRTSSAASWLALRTFPLQTQVAYTIGWTAVSSELTYYTSLYGPEILLWLNVSGCAALCGCRHLVSESKMCRWAPILGLVLPGGLLRAVCARHDAPDADRRKVRPCIRGRHCLSVPLCCR